MTEAVQSESQKDSQYPEDQRSSRAGVGTAHLSSELDSDGPYTISGVAIGAGDVTVGSSGIKKRWPGSELKDAASSLEGQPLVRDHENNTDGRVGTVTEATYKKGVGVLYEAEIAPHYEQLAKDIAAGIQEVSARAYHDPVDELEEDDDGALVTTNIMFDNLSVVSQGAAPSNTAEIGGISVGDAVAMAQGPSGGAVATLEAGSERPDPDEEDTEELGHLYDIGDLIEWGDDRLGSITGVFVEDGVHMYEVRVLERGENGVETTDETASVIAHNARRGPHVPTSDLKVESNSEHGESEPEESDVSELEAAWHTPDWSGLDDSREWEKPAMEDFDTDDLSEIDDHFFVSKTGEWPPENYGDLALPAVWPNGDLSEDGLESVVQMAKQTDDVSDDVAESIQDKAEELLDEHFDEPNDSESATAYDDAPSEPSTLVAATLSDTDQQNTNDSIMTTEIDYEDATEDDIEEMSDAVVMEQDDVESLREKAEEADELSEKLDSLNSSLDELADNQEKIEDVDEDALDELREYDEAVVLTEDEHEELQGLVDDIGSVFAEELAEYSAFEAEELQERFTPLELRDKVEQHDEASVASELGASEEDPEPEGGSADPEELEQSNEEAEREATEEELREAVADHLEDGKLYRQAEKVRDGEISLDEMGIDPESVLN